MVAIPIPVSSSPGIKGQEGSGALINAYAEKQGETARFPVIWKRPPGLREIHTIGSSHIHLRGAIVVASTLICVMDTRVHTVTVSGVTYSSVNRGALAGTDIVTVAVNNAGTPNIVCVSPAQGCFNLFTGSAPTSFADADLPQPNSVSELNGYFLWTIGDGRIFASGLNAVTVSASAYTTEQSAGGLLRGVTFRGEFFAFGARRTGVYTDIGASPFPLQRRDQTIQRGIAGTNAVAGWEPGGPDQLIWAGDDGIVYRMNGYTPEAISNEDVSRDVRDAIEAGDGGDLVASVYTSGKHKFWVLTLPGSWTWEYNITTSNWQQRTSFNTDDWRASTIVRAFNKWIAGDQTTGKLFQLDDTYHKEADDPLIWEIVTGVPPTFPARGAVLRADFDFTTGVGVAAGDDPIQTDPVVQIAWSKDGGHNFSNFVNRALGSEGETYERVTVHRVGQFGQKGIRFKLRVSDPVHLGFMGGQMAIEQRAA